MCLTKKQTLSMGFMLLLCLSLTISLSYGADTISANISISGDETIISKDGNFELGFFRPGNSFNYYIGIWYKKYSSGTPTIVWVANRETPISDRFSSKLKVSDGNLVLLNESKLPIWSTNVTFTSNLDSAIAVILDNGNLVLRDSLNSSVEPVWQSFDNPAHCWLSGAKFSYNKRKNKSQLLTSWKSTDDPAVGLFSFELVPPQKLFVLKWNGSKRYWDTASWDPLMINDIYNISYQTNENESYFTYAAYNPSFISRFVIDVSGQIQQQTWLESTKQWNVFWAQPGTQCQVYGLCGVFGICKQNGFSYCNCLTGFKPRFKSEWNQSDFSGGCVRKTNLNCREYTEKLEFLMIKVTSLPLNNSLAVGNAGECQMTCFNNCLCNAYSLVHKDCLIWEGELLNLSEDDVDGKTIYIKVASKDLPSHKKNKRVSMATIVGSVAGLIFLLGLMLLIIYGRKRIFVRKTTMEGSLMAFAYKDLQTATKSFSEKLGEGGFGSVFKGVLRDSSIVAVKKLESVRQGEKEFRNEVSTIGTIQHVNLVRLRGFCAQGNSKLLVYDYMPNSSLNFHLFHEKQDSVLSWKTRYEIALGIARGLVYLHEKCRECIIHCDIKPENILLDADFCPKISDFGLAKLVGRDFSRVLTTMRGTRGYLAPEWLSGLAVTVKADVFSYGMMLFELVHGKRNTLQSENSSFTFFPSMVANVLMEGDDTLSLLDGRLNREANVEEVTKICKVACWCIQDDEDKRPSMSYVVQILEGVLEVNMPPIPQSVQLFDHNTEHLVFIIKSSSSGDSQSKNT